MVKLIDVVGREGVYKIRKNTRDNLLVLKLSKRDVFCELEATEQVNLWNKGWHDYRLLAKSKLGAGPQGRGKELYICSRYLFVKRKLDTLLFLISKGANLCQYLGAWLEMTLLEIISYSMKWEPYIHWHLSSLLQSFF